ncbi:M42 family metallopeptidase [Lutispora thermophila]|uniref:Endoglucanase n=1 Tax=Lutispora thermophila DSM 19022 TaxID=1122184 RepID=A0A1M6B635_9FIRM|nr:M42 family metallopeptidase [Lutispora thermophila]SHI44176.1 endoglucanase [Lutispora thermophila DSM 19022]
MLLKRLTDACGMPGGEGEVRQIILEEIKPYVDDIKVDRLGNVIATKNGKPGYPKVMIAAHMDEVGLMVKSIDDGGFIRFEQAGGLDERILVSKPVLVGKNKIQGVIGAKAIHLQEKGERETPLRTKQLYIDIGAKSKEDTEKLVKPGDYIAFDSEYVEFGNNLIKAKALDDRAGCAALIETLKHNYDVTVVAVFTVQEEIGLRGATVAAYKVNPDIALVLEGTLCSDVSNVPEQSYITKLGAGPAISLMDSRTIFPKNLAKRIYDIAVKNGVDIQYRLPSSGGNDAGAIHTTREGIPCTAISVPCRYIHSPSCVMSKDDFEGLKKIVKLFLEDIKEGEYIRD